MITHAHHLAAQPPAFAAPFGLLLAGLVGDVPRYEREKMAGGRGSPYVPVENAKKRTKNSIDTRNRIFEILKAGGKMMTQEIRDVAGLANSSVYDHLSALADEGFVTKMKVSGGTAWAAI